LSSIFTAIYFLSIYVLLCYFAVVAFDNGAGALSLMADASRRFIMIV
jgi:hypothetical protein